MDYSFGNFLEPRRIPEPTSFLKNNLDSVVPDVSFIEKFDSKTSYNSWKSKNTQTAYTTERDFNKENCNRNTNNVKKQVSFFTPENNSFEDAFPFGNTNFTSSKTPLQCTTNVPKSPSTPSVATLLNHELELSLIDPHKKPPNLQNQNTFKSNSYRNWLRMMEQEKQLAELKHRVNDEPTVNDLYKMVQDQNENLKNLQKQVEILLQQNFESHENKRNFQQTVNNTSNDNICSCKCNNKIISTRNAETNTSINPVQISIGVMTSFQINVNTEQTKETPTNQNLISPNLIKDTPLTSRFPNKNFNSNLTTECIGGMNSRFREYSLSEIPEIPEPLEESLSESGSIHVDLQEFQESSDEEEIINDTEEDVQTNKIGWTVYNNVVDQVQNILETSPKEDDKENIKMSVINQFHDLGINISDMNIPMLLDPEFLYKQQRGTSSNDMSIEVNQLVMKYLRDDQLSFLVAKKASPKSPNNNEMSFSTIKYMQKYRLWGQISKSPDKFQYNVQKVRTNQEYHPSQNRRYMSQNKILDITALKQQPKLL